MNDQYTTLSEIKQQVRSFVEARDWQQFHSGKNLAMSIAIEAAELMEHFQWLDGADYAPERLSEQKKAEIAEELADVLIYAMSFGNHFGLDLSAAIAAKLAKNEGRFPVEACKLGTD